MQPAVMLRLLQTYLVICLWATVPACDILCSYLPLVPPRWSYNGEDVSNKAMKCGVQSDCDLDIENILRSEVEDGDGRYIDIDLHFTCTNNSTLKFNRTAQGLNSLCVTVHTQDCTASWDNLADLGTKLNLLRIEVIVTPLSPPPPKQLSSSSLHGTGLDQVNHLELTFLDVNQSAKVEDYFMMVDQPMKNVASLYMQCFEGDKRKNQQCTKPIVTFNQKQLRELFPHLQALLIGGVFPRELDIPLSFPWDSNPMSLPLNFTHSRFQQQVYSNGYIVQQDDHKISRMLTVVGDLGLDISKVCPRGEVLNALIIRRYMMRSIPGDCFSPSLGSKSHLYYLDLSRNLLATLPLDLFRGLHSLEELHLDNIKLEQIEPGQFDDLSNVMLLSFDYNFLKVIKKGTFSKQVSLRALFIHSNPTLTLIERGTLPNYSRNLTFLDFRWNDLEKLPLDCTTLPNMYRCDCDHNKRLSIENFTEIIIEFDPIQMYRVQPLAYYGNTYFFSDYGVTHETDQSTISIRDCAITNIDFNLSWPLEHQKQLAAFLSFFQIDMGTIYPQDAMLQCDCNLYDLSVFIGNQNPSSPISLLSGSRYPHSLLLSFTNFVTWKCKVHPILMLNYMQGSFLTLAKQNFICPDPLIDCPKRCSCLRGAYDTRMIIDCSNRSLSSFPENIVLPSKCDRIIISLEHNKIGQMPDCIGSEFAWLKHVTHLNVQNNGMTPARLDWFTRFLRCMPNITHLYLANNNIEYLPPSIQRINFEVLSINGNRLQCCDAYWMKEWLQMNNQSILESLTVQCNHREHPIVQLERADFHCVGLSRQWQVIFVLIAVMILTALIAVTIYIYGFELKIILFEKLNLHPLNRFNDSDPSKTHDIYLMYSDSEADCTWVEEHLLPTLQKLHFRVFVPDRDLVLGRVKSEERAKALQQSHRVVVIVSQDFIDNDILMNQLHMAHQHETSISRKRYLVLVKRNNSRLDLEKYPLLKQYLSPNFFVSVNSKLFWPKLRYWLPIVKANLPDLSENTVESNDAESDCAESHELQALLG